MPLTNKITDLGPNLRASCRRSCRRWDHPRGFPVTSGSTSGQWINSWINQIHQWDDDSPLVIPTSIMRNIPFNTCAFFQRHFHNIIVEFAANLMKKHQSKWSIFRSKTPGDLGHCTTATWNGPVAEGGLAATVKSKREDVFFTSRLFGKPQKTIEVDEVGKFQLKLKNSDHL